MSKRKQPTTSRLRAQLAAAEATNAEWFAVCGENIAKRVAAESQLEAARKALEHAKECLLETMTIDDIYATINPLPAMLSAKGKVKPEVDCRIEANAGISVTMNWKKPFTNNDWEKEYEHFMGSNFEEALAKAMAFIKELPTAEQAKLHRFMGKLGKLIDASRDEGINVDYLNPLVDTMKRLSENVIGYKPEHEEIAF